MTIVKIFHTILNDPEKKIKKQCIGLSQMMVIKAVFHGSFITMKPNPLMCVK